MAIDYDDFVARKEYKPFKVIKSEIFSWKMSGEKLVRVDESDINGILKITETSHGTNYFIKKGPAQQFFNPWSMYNHGKNSLKYKDNSGRSWQWTRVPEASFNQYVLFLKTKNTARYTAATRIYLYGDKE